MNPKFLVADVETTGLDPEVDKIVEVAWCELTNDTGIVLDSEFDTLVNPERSIPCDSAGLTGIRSKDVEDSPVIADIDFPQEEVILISHNAPFDYSFLKDHMNIVGTMCTLLLSRRLLPGPENYKLSTLSCHCELPRQLSHRALADVRDCAGVIEYMCEGLSYDLNQMLAYHNDDVILEFCQVGRKWNGHLWSEVPKGYLVWLLGGDFDRDSVNTAKYWLNK